MIDRFWYIYSQENYLRFHTKKCARMTSLKKVIEKSSLDCPNIIFTLLHMLRQIFNQERFS